MPETTPEDDRRQVGTCSWSQPNPRGVGTWESGRLLAAGDRHGPQPMSPRFVAELNQAFPSLDLTIDDITLVHYAAVPAS
jgi:hypothetical protein